MKCDLGKFSLTNYWSVPIADQRDEIIPIIDLQRTFLATALACFVLVPWLLSRKKRVVDKKVRHVN